ncbi:MAG: abortive infection family protein [Alphaproteobacteria bacterium]|nr:abortive infection family protein [Alphaproteobacteria bacterium]
MWLSNTGISFVCNLLTGNSGLTATKSKEFILDFLNKHIDNIKNFEEYCTENNLLDEREALQSYCQIVIKQIKGCSKLTQLVEDLLNNRNFFIDKTVVPMDTYSVEEAVFAFNQNMSELNDNDLPRDPYNIKLINKKYKVTSIDDLIVDFRVIEESDNLTNYNLINQTSQKCMKRLHEMDYSGTITVARTLLEQITREIIIQQGKSFDNNDDIKTLVNKCLKSLDFDISQMPNDLKEIYGKVNSGFSTISQGLGRMRNCMSDSHSSTCIATENDAILAINVSRTMSSFLLNRYCLLHNGA